MNKLSFQETITEMFCDNEMNCLLNEMINDYLADEPEVVVSEEVEVDELEFSVEDIHISLDQVELFLLEEIEMTQLPRFSFADVVNNVASVTRHVFIPASARVASLCW